MKIDLHFHTKKYSECSSIDLEEGICYAKWIGLDGICITEHDIIPDIHDVDELVKKHDIAVFIGVEINTLEGDILCFGLKDMPRLPISAQELIDKVNSDDGVCIAAHPFRNNNRGLGDKLNQVEGLHAVEVLNGNTDYNSNMKAMELASKLNLVQVGSSDAHKIGNIGRYYTQFKNKICTERELIEAIRRNEITNIGSLII